MRPRTLALGGVLGPAAFIGCWTVAGISAGSSPVDRAISDLAAVGAPSRATMTAGFVVFGVGVIAFGFAVRALLEGPAWIAAVVTGLCTLGVAATPLGGWSGDGVHAAFAGLGYAALVAEPLLASGPFARRSHRGWAYASRLGACASAVCLLATTLGPAHGLWQRLGLTLGDVWIVATALAIVASRGPFADETARAEVATPEG